MGQGLPGAEFPGTPARTCHNTPHCEQAVDNPRIQDSSRVRKHRQASRRWDQSPENVRPYAKRAPTKGVLFAPISQGHIAPRRGEPRKCCGQVHVQLHSAICPRLEGRYQTKTRTHLSQNENAIDGLGDGDDPPPRETDIKGLLYLYRVHLAFTRCAKHWMDLSRYHHLSVCKKSRLLPAEQRGI